MSQPVRLLLRASTTLFAFCVALTPAAAQDIKVGIGYGLAFLPIYVCEDLRLVEKHAKEAHLDVKATYQRFVSAAALREAIAAGTIDIGPFGTAPLLIAWEQAKDTPSQIFAVSGLSSLPLVLLSNQPNVQSLDDLKPADRIAVPTLSSPQKYLLEIQSEKKMFGWFNYDAVDKQLVAMSHADAIAALVEGSTPGAEPAAEHVTAYFSSPPFTQIALRDANIHSILTSSDVADGRFSFLIMGATKAYIDAQPQMLEIFDKAIDDAAHIIHDDPRRAAQIYLTHEPSGTLNGPVMESVIREIRDEFGSAVYGVQSVADFLGRHGLLKSPPKSWKDVVAPALVNSPSS